MNEKTKKDILVLTPHFLAFVYDQVIELAKCYSNINVVVVYPKAHPAKSKGTKLSKKMKIDKRKLPPNVHIFEESYFTIPGKAFQHLRGNSSYKLVKKIIKNNNIHFDLIHSHFLWPLGYTGSKLKKDYDVPFVVTGHGYDVYDLPFRTPEWTKRIKKVLKAADAVITVSKKNKEFLLKILNRKIDVIPNGYNSDIFRPDINIDRKKLNIPSNKKIILSVGNLESIKGHKYLIEAVEKIIVSYSNIYCIIVGGGRKFSYLTSLIKSKNLENHIRLVGSVAPEDVPDWMSACDVFVLPSLNEGVPTVLFEALGTGKPFVGSKVGGIPEIITDEKLGTLIPSGDSDILSSAILDAINREWDENYIANNAKKFSWDKIASQITTVYENALQRPKSNIDKNDNIERGNLQSDVLQN